MDLDGEEERMLRAIVQTAVVAAAAGRPLPASSITSWFVRPACRSTSGVAKVAVAIWHRGRMVADARCVVSLDARAAGDDDVVVARLDR